MSYYINKKYASSGRTVVAIAFIVCSLLSFGNLAFAFTTTRTTTTTTTTTTPFFSHVQQRSNAQLLQYRYIQHRSPLVIDLYNQSNNILQSSLSFLPRSSLLPRKVIPADNNDNDDDQLFNLKTTIALVGGQSLLIGVAILIAKLVGTPNYGFGANVDFSLSSIGSGILWSLPLGLLAVVLDLVEDRFPALEDVSKATQSSVLSFLGGKFKPLIGILVSLALGLAAGFGEEMLFRGVLQNELGIRIGSDAIAVGIASIIFGLLHAVTPLYAFLAALASVYFGWLYLITGNLAIPIVTHAFYDWAALLYAHWTVANLTDCEQQAILEWRLGDSATIDGKD